MEIHLNSLNSESLKVGLKINRGKTTYTTNYTDSEDIQTDQDKIYKGTKLKYLGQTTFLKDTTQEEIYARQRKTLTEGYILQWMDKAQVKGERIKHAEELRFCEGVDGGLQPAVDGQSSGER